MTETEAVAALGRVAHPMVGANDDYDALLDDLKDARFVLLGEATHGTHEFYRERARITRRLITRHGFVGVAAEADWPEAWRVHRYVNGRSADNDSIEAMGDFERFPAWMWRNADVLDFVGWLREHHDRHGGPAGFYGLDLYSLHRSASAVIDYLSRVDPDAATRARDLYACLDQAGVDPQKYGLGAVLGLTPSCEDAVVRILDELRAHRPTLVDKGGPEGAEDFFYAEQNARTAKDAEAYYRGMFRRRVSTWNLRDGHMVETLAALSDHLERTLDRPVRLVVWAHNSHCGDARATEVSRHGEVNIGQLCRERWGDKVRLVGFSTYSGSVTAASAWGGPAERKRVRPARADSWEALLHKVGRPRFWFDTRDPRVRPMLTEERLGRAIGVLYLPETERQSHYYGVRLGNQFDYVLHFDHTRAVEPLERTTSWELGELPETFPSAL
ncbi:MAG: erythromycin esterase family protein [Pseudomonadota bacterium]|nr:erythromycin esterase family protein [Pseudomonadota bacterium]